MNKINFRAAVAVGLSLALLAPALEAAKRQGARVIVTKTDSSIVQGELLAVGDGHLILMDESTLTGITANLADIRDVIVIKKRGRFWRGAGIGLAAGAAVGAIGGATSNEKPHTKDNWLLPHFSRGQLALAGGITFGVLGGVIGGVIAAMTGGHTDKINVQSAESPATTIAKLRKLAKEQS